MTRYYDRVVQLRPLAHDDGELLERIDCPEKRRLGPDEEPPDLRSERGVRTAVLLHGNLNHDTDAQALLGTVRRRLSRDARVLVVTYSPYWGALVRLATRLGFRNAPQPETFLTFTSLAAVARLCDLEVVRWRYAAYVPFRLLGLGAVLNALLPAVPGLRRLGLATVVSLRATNLPREAPRSISVVVPARNERGNVEPALRRMPDLGAPTEVLFVEGHSTDGTWDEIRRVAAREWPGLTVRALRQPGRGKADAARLGLARATGELLVILDADLTMPPELLGRFVDAWARGLADFVYGDRLTYPMEGEAMRPLNRLGNVFFAKALAFVLDAPVSDALCGTKVVAGHDYRRFERWRSDFGFEDPFGDFELLFPASVLGLGLLDVPIRYRARTYGATNIRRFRDGLRLLGMTVGGFWRLRLARAAPRRAAASRAGDLAERLRVAHVPLELDLPQRGGERGAVREEGEEVGAGEPEQLGLRDGGDARRARAAADRAEVAEELVGREQREGDVAGATAHGHADGAATDEEEPGVA